MDCRKLALLACVAASCAGCVTETTTVDVPPESMSKLAKYKGIKEEVYPKQEVKPEFWVRLGELKEDAAKGAELAPYEQNGRRDEARKAYQNAIDLDPKCVAAQIHLANLFLKQDDPDRAIAIYQKALQVNPKSAQLWYEASGVYCRRQDFPNALQCHAKAHELDPQDRFYATQYGLCLARAGQADEAVTVLSRVMNKAEANYNVARMMAQINRPELSKHYVDAALALQPTHQGALTFLAQLEGRGNNRAPAVAGGTVDSNVMRAPAVASGAVDSNVMRASLSAPR